MAAFSPLRSPIKRAHAETMSDPKTVTTANKPAIGSEQLGHRPRFGQRLVERIGNTPLLRLERASAEFPNVEFYAKAEWFNPGGSVKDRAAYAMICEGERRGALRPG